MCREYRTSKYIKLTENLLKEFANVPKYSCKYSKRVFTQVQHCVLHVLRQATKMTYRDFIEWLKATDRLLKILKLKRIPHFDTLNKFAKRAKPQWFHKAISAAADIAGLKDIIIAIDSTGFSQDYASDHYRKRIDRKGLTKGYIKLSSTCCIRSKLFLGASIRKKPANDHRDFKPLVNRAAKRGLRRVLADKGYDSEKNHEFCIRLGAESVIPLRVHSMPGYRTHGKHRKRLKKYFPQKKYNQRSLIESAFGALKRRYGSKLYGRRFKTQKIELLSRISAYNSRRLVELNSLLGHFWPSLAQGFRQSLLAYEFFK